MKIWIILLEIFREIIYTDKNMDNSEKPTKENLKENDSNDENDNKHADENQNHDAISSYDTLKPIEWSIENEMILVEWCDIAQCYKWLNYQSYQRCSLLQAWFTIPVIIMSTVTGTASFAQSNFSESERLYVQFGIGTINILVGILSTISQYLKISQLTESHRISSISWDKYARNIRIELAKAPEERMDAAHFMKLSRHEFDRLMETSPMIQPEIVEEFKKHFKGTEGTEQNRLYVELRKPDICDTIISSNVYRHRWYEKNDTPKNTIIYSSEKTEKRQQPIKELFKENIFTIAKKIKANKEKIERYVTLFNETYGRKPLKTEVMKHFEQDIDTLILDKYFESADFSDDCIV